ALVADLHFHPGKGRAHGFELDVAVPVDAKDAAGFRLAVALLEVDPQGVEKAEHVGPQGRARGVGLAQAQETEAVLHQAVEGKVEKPVEQLKAQGYGLAGKAQVGHFEPYVEPPMENLPLEPSGVLHFDPDLAHLGL